MILKCCTLPFGPKCGIDDDEVELAFGGKREDLFLR